MGKRITTGETVELWIDDDPWVVHRIKTPGSRSGTAWQAWDKESGNTWTYKDDEGSRVQCWTIYKEKTGALACPPYPAVKEEDFHAAGLATLGLLTGEVICRTPRCYDCAPPELKAALDAVWSLYESKNQSS